MVNSVCEICIDIVLNSCKDKMVHSELLQYAEHVSELFNFLILFCLCWKSCPVGVKTEQ